MKLSLLALLIALATPAQAIEDKAGITAWFAQYDALSKKGDVEAMAAMAMFPIQVVTNDAKGEGYAETWTRERFVQMMTQAMKDTPKDLQMTAKRQPFFLNDDLAVVITDATIVTGKQKSTMRYADVLVKQGGVWKFQTMAQAGWADMLKAQPKAAPANH